MLLLLLLLLPCVVGGCAMGLTASPGAPPGGIEPSQSSSVQARGGVKTPGGGPPVAPATRADPAAIFDALRPAPARPWSSAAAYRHYLAGAVAFEEGAFGLAERELSEAVLHDPSSAALRLALARARWKAGRHEAALTSAKTALELDPGLTQAWRLLAKIQGERGDPSGAEATLRAAIAAAPEQAGPHLDLAALLLSVGRGDEALATFGALDALHLRSGTPWRALARSLERAGHLAQARIALGRARLAAPEDASAAEAEGRVCQALLERACAVAAYAEALERSTERFYLLLRMARLLGELGRDEEAREAEERLLAGDPTSPDLLLQVALGAAERGAYDLSVERLRAARRRAPHRRDLWFFEGYLLETRGEREAALRAYGRAVTDPTHGLDARLARAALMARLGRDRAALVELSRIARARGEDRPAVDRLALKIEILGRLGEAEAIDALIETLPTGLEHELRVLAARSGAWIDLGRPDAALRLLRAELRARPRDQSLRFLLATLLQRLERRAEALEMMQQVIATGPDRADALNFVAYAFAEEGTRLAQAEALVRRALWLEPNNGYILDTLGWVLLRQARPTEALKVLRRAVRMLPGEADILEHLREAQAREQKPAP